MKSLKRWFYGKNEGIANCKKIRRRNKKTFTITSDIIRQNRYKMEKSYGEFFESCRTEKKYKLKRKRKCRKI